MTSSLPVPAVLPRRRRTPARIRWIRYGVVALLIAAIAVAAVVVVRQPAQPVYRTATVGYGPVTQTLNGVVAVEPVDQAAVSFPVSGTVSGVNVSVGETVAAGATLATLDPTTLEQSLHQAQAKLATAQLTLNEAENGQGTTSLSSGSGALATAATAGTGTGAVTLRRGSQAILTAAQLPSPTSAPGGSGGTGGGGSAQLHADEQAVIQGQHQVDMAMAAAAQAMASAAQVCGPIINSGSGGGPGPSPSASPSAPPSPSPSGSGDASSCYQALSALLTAQQHVQSAEKTLAVASTTFDQNLSQQAASSSSTKSGGSFSRSSSSAPATGTGSSAGRTLTAPSAADLVADEKAVDADAGMVSVAQQALDQATIVSPVAGRVVAVNLSPGAAVQADSSSQNVMVAASDGYEAVTMVGVSSLPNVKLGDNATVTVDGAGQPLFGTVTAISLVGTSESTGTAYPVVISLSGTSSALRDGATGTDSIVTDGAGRALAVPTSAVHDTNGRYSVTVLKGSSVTTVRVTVGAIGATWTQVTGGLSAGETVVIADLSQALPSSATSQSSTTGRGTGGFAGAGGFRGGFAGGGAAGG